MKKNRSKLLKNLCFILIGNLLVFSLIELLSGLLLFIIPPHVYKLEPCKKEIYDKLIGLFAPDQKVILQYYVPFKISINSLGLRGKDDFSVEKTPGTYRILAVGDSFTFGYCVSKEEEVLSGILSSKIKSDLSKKYEVLNCGMGSTSIRGQYKFIRDKLLRLKPDMVVLTFCTNDISDLLYDRDAYENLTEYILNDKTPLLEQTNAYKVIHRLYLLYLIKRNVLGALENFNVGLENRVDYDIDKQVKRFKKLCADTNMLSFEYPVPDKTMKLWKTYEDYLYKTKELLDKNNVKLVFAVIPSCPQIFSNSIGTLPQEMLKKMCKKFDISFLDYLPYFIKDKNKKFLYALPYDFHLSIYGHKVMGNILYNYLIGKGILV